MNVTRQKVERAQLAVLSQLWELARDLVGPVAERWGVLLWDPETLEVTEEGFCILEAMIDLPSDLSELPVALVEAELKRAGQGAKASDGDHRPESPAPVPPLNGELPPNVNGYKVPPRTPEAMGRFLEKIETDQRSGCWLWTGSHKRTNPTICFQQFDYNATRAALWLCRRHYLAARVLPDKTCGETSCVNPDHLEVEK